MRIIKRKGRYDFCSNNEEWCIQILGLPDNAPAKSISEHWPIDDEPDIDDAPPSEVVELISERLESYWLNTAREEKRKVIEWAREHAEEIDSQWAKIQIEQKQKLIERLQDEIDDLKDMVVA